MALSYEKLNELFTGVGLKLGEEQTRKCYDVLEGYYKEITVKKKGSGRASGYMMWLNDNRENIRDVHLKGVELTGRSKVTVVAKKYPAEKNQVMNLPKNLPMRLLMTILTPMVIPPNTKKTVMLTKKVKRKQIQFPMI